MSPPLPTTKSTRSSPRTGPAIDWTFERSITPPLVAVIVCTSSVPNLSKEESMLWSDERSSRLLASVADMTVALPEMSAEE